MKKTILSITVILVLVIASYAIIMPDKELKPSQIMILNINYNKGNISLESYQITKGFAQNRKDVINGDYRLEINDANNKIAYTSFFDKPAVIAEYLDNNKITGNLIELDEHVFNIIVPFKQDFSTINILDSNNNLLAKQDFSWLWKNEKTILPSEMTR